MEENLKRNFNLISLQHRALEVAIESYNLPSRVLSQNREISVCIAIY